MKEIGSIFPLSDELIEKAQAKVDVLLPNDLLYFSLCREAIYEIAKTYRSGNATVLIPAYTCQTVFAPFRESGWDVKFFPIKKDLRIDIPVFNKLIADFRPSMILVHPYFGMDLNDDEWKALFMAKSKGIKLVIDNTQCLFSRKTFEIADFVVGSYRKWFPIPDGAFLWQSGGIEGSSQLQGEFSLFVSMMTEAMNLRDAYFKNWDHELKLESIKINKEANYFADNEYDSHRMAHISSSILAEEDIEWIAERRIENFNFLWNNIPNSELIKKVCREKSELTTAPLYFTIYSSQRTELQKYLAQNSIYAPVLWPVVDDSVMINDEVKYIYENILAIPIDQRYDLNDMQRIVEVLLHKKY